MGWDISYHPVGKDEIQSIYFKGLADPEYYKELVTQFDINDFYAERLRKCFEEARNLEDDISFNKGHVFYIAMVFGFLRKYQYIRGAALSFLAGDPDIDPYIDDWKQFVPEAYQDKHFDNCLTENYCGGAYLSNESLKRLREDYKTNPEIREKLNETFSSAGLEVFWQAVDDAIENGLGLVEATEIVQPNPFDLSDIKCYSNLLNCDHAGLLVYAEAATQQISAVMEDNQNDAENQFQHAVAYFNGDSGVERDCKKAIELFTKAAQQGSINAQFSLGLIYETGNCLEQSDPVVALQWYQKAAEAGDEEAKAKVAEFAEKGITLEVGKNVPASATMTDSEFKKALKSNHLGSVIAGVLFGAFGIFLFYNLVVRDSALLRGVNLAGEIFMWFITLLMLLIGFYSLHEPISSSLKIKLGKHPLLNAIRSQDTNYVSWFYLAVTTVQGIKPVHEIVIHSNDGRRLAFQSDASKSERVLNYLREKFPNAMEGNTTENAERYEKLTDRVNL